MPHQKISTTQLISVVRRSGAFKKYVVMGPYINPQILVVATHFLTHTNAKSANEIGENWPSWRACRRSLCARKSEPSDFLPDDITVFQEPIYDISKCNRSVEEIFMLLKKLCNVITRVIFCNTLHSFFGMLYCFYRALCFSLQEMGIEELGKWTCMF